MVVIDSMAGIELNAFMDRYGNNRAKQELLLFWALHPNARFSRLAVLSAMECSRLDAEKALSCMVSEELINMRSDNGLTTYSLTSSENIRQMVSLLNTLDWRQRQIMFARFHQAPGT